MAPHATGFDAIGYALTLSDQAGSR